VARMRGTLRSHLTRVLVIPAGLLACQLVTPDLRLDDTLLVNGVCEADTKRCFGGALYVCNENLDGWTRLTDCASEARCDSKAQRCRACAPDELRCVGQTLQGCKLDQNGSEAWVPLRECAADQACNVQLENCARCVEGTLQCNDGQLFTCQGGSWAFTDDCGGPDACSVSSNGKSGGCTSLCTANDWKCDENRLLRCDAKGTAWHFVELCESNVLCNEAKDQPLPPQALRACPVPRCQTGQYSCEKNVLSQCQGGSWVFVEDCAGGSCSTSSHSCQACTSGAVDCWGPELRRCENGAWQLLETCQSAILCDRVSARCDPACSRSRPAQCSNMSEIVRCGISGKEVKDACASTTLCNLEEQRCDDTKCVRDSFRCQGAELQKCSERWDEWRFEQTCPTEASCDPQAGNCAALPCQANTHRCNGRFLERCNASGAFERIEGCPSSEDCSATDAMCRPSCKTGEQKCETKKQQTCGPGGFWGVAFDCEFGCDALNKACKLTAQ